MMVVLASRHDLPALDFVARLAPDAGLLTCQDLSTRGWWYEPGSPIRTLVVGGQRIPGDEIDGVFSRLPSVDENELTDIVPGDRGYVAAEMTAFLTAWLSEVSCPVLNRPTPASLMGPHLRNEKWAHLAAGLGIPAAPVLRSVPGAAGDRLPDAGRAVVVNVIGRLCTGHPDLGLRAAALTLAAAAGVGLLRVIFAAPEAGSAFLGADYWVDLDDPAVASAVVRYFGDGRAR
jgi:hypothetical protein